MYECVTVFVRFFVCLLLLDENVRNGRSNLDKGIFLIDEKNKVAFRPACEKPKVECSLRRTELTFTPNGQLSWEEVET